MNTESIMTVANLFMEKGEVGLCLLLRRNLRECGEIGVYATIAKDQSKGSTVRTATTLMIWIIVQTVSIPPGTRPIDSSANTMIPTS